MNSPKVSVVIPNYNYGRFLAECFDSMLAQTWQDWEVVVADDSSTDDSRAVIQSYVDRYPQQFRLVALTGGPSGTPRAVNAGVRAMRGSYFTWLSSDDRCMPAKLERLVDMLEAHPEVGLVHTAYRIINGSGEFTDVTVPGNYPGTSSFFRLLEGNIVNGSTVLIRKTMLDEIGPLLETDDKVPDLWRIAEYLWWLEIAMRADVACIQEPLHEFRIHSMNSDYNTSTFGPGLVRLSKRHFLAKYGLNNVVTTLCGRSGAPRAEVYRKLARILAADTLPEDTPLFMEALREEGQAEYDGAVGALRRAQQGWASGLVAEYYASKDTPVPAATLRSLDPESAQTAVILLRLLNHAKQAYQRGDFAKAISLLRTIIGPAASQPALHLSARYYLGLSLGEAGQNAEAIVEFEGVLALEPDHRSAREGMERLRYGTTFASDQLAHHSGSR